MDLTTIAGRLKAARQHIRDMTQSRLARDTELPSTTISKWECGEMQPRIEHVAKLARALGVSFEWLALGEGDVPDLSVAVDPAAAAQDPEAAA